MGLDMYLTGKRYISKHFNDGDEDKASAIQEMFPELKGRSGRWGDASPVKEVQIEAGYWRKANAIHDWFVQNVQGGEDECRPHYVSREDLESLKATCQKVLDDPQLAPSLLPTASGFFFGDTSYNEYYFDDLKETIQIVDDVLELPSSWEFEYRSSW